MENKSFLRKIITSYPIILLFISTLNEFDFNFLEMKFFSFNFNYILIFYFSLKKSNDLGYGTVFIAGLINDVVTGYPIGVSSLSYLLICGFAAYLRNITLNPNIIKDWLFFLLTILVVNSLTYSLSVLFFSIDMNYLDLLINLFFTFILYIIFKSMFDFFDKVIFGYKND